MHVCVYYNYDPIKILTRLLFVIVDFEMFEYDCKLFVRQMYCVKCIGISIRHEKKKFE